MDFLDTKKVLKNNAASIFSDIVFDDYLDTFTQEVISIYVTYADIKDDIYLQEIMKIPWIFCKRWDYKEKENLHWSTSTFDQFKRLCLRLFEFCLNILVIGNQHLNSFYLAFDTQKYNDLIHFYFENFETIQHRGFCIKQDKSKNHIDFIDSVCQISIKYPPKGQAQAFKDFSNPLEKYLKINQYTRRIYEGEDSNNVIEGRNPKGQSGKRQAYETSDTDFTNILIERKRSYHSTEEKKENANKSNIASSPFLNNDSKKILGFMPKSEKNHFKRVKIARAISANIAKTNQNLLSDYKVPDRRLFSVFIKTKIICSPMSFERNLFLASFLLGIHYEKLLRSMLGMEDSIIIDPDKSTLSVQLDTSIFAGNNKDIEEYSHGIKSTQRITTHLPLNLVRLLKNLDTQITKNISESNVIKEEITALLQEIQIVKETKFQYTRGTSIQFKKSLIAFIADGADKKRTSEISNKLTRSSFLDSFFDKVSTDLSQFIKQTALDFPKRIVLYANRLPHIHKIYLNQQHKESCTERLFFSHIKKSEEVKMCYTTMPATYTIQKNWYLMLQKYLDINIQLNTLFNCHEEEYLDDKTDTKAVGSPFFIQSGKSKNFFLSLMNEINNPNLHELVKDSIKMVYIRYALSLLLGTRDFHHSCDLYEYSRTYGIITIQEKAKEARSSKRIIPVCQTAKDLIDIFFQIKDKYDYPHHTPFLLTAHGDTIVFEAMTQKNLIAWLDKRSLNIDSAFIKNIPQNYGRHVIKSSKLSSDTKDEHIDAFLNHHSSGTEDQGKFSTFSNRRYTDEMRTFLESIAEGYLPRYGTENLR